MKPKFPSLRGASLFITLGLAASLPSAALAAPVIWDGDTNTDFADGFNWTGDAAPADNLTTDVATFTGTPTANQPDLSFGDRSVNGLDFQSAGWTLSGAFTLSLGGGGITSTGNNVVSVPLNLANATTFTANGGYISLANTSTGAISGTGQLTVAGNNIVYFDSFSNSYSGGTIIKGTASIKNINSLGTADISLDGGTLASNGAAVDTAGRVISLTALGGTLTANGSRIGVGGSTSISGPGQLTIGAGSSTVFLDNANTYAGGTLVKGLVSLKNSSALGGTGPVTFEGGKITNNNTSITLAAAQTVTLGTGGGTIYTTGTSNLTIAGVISGSTLMTILPGNSTGAVVLSNTSATTPNTFSGNILVQGLLRATGGSSLGAATNTVTLDGGTLGNNSSNLDTANRNIVLTANGGTLNVNGGSTRRIGVGGTSTISGPGLLTIAGNGNTFLDNANTNSGGTLVTGICRPKGDSTLGATNGLITLSGGTFQPNQTNVTYPSTRLFHLDANGGTFIANGTATINGVVDGPGSLTIGANAGTFVLGAANTYAGNTILADATSKLRVTGTLGSGTYAGIISGPGVFEYAGSGIQTLAAANTLGGPVTITSGTLRVGNPAALGFGSVRTTLVNGTTVASGATLGLNGTANVAEPITLNGTGVGGNGALINDSGTTASISSGIVAFTVPATGSGSGYSVPPVVAIGGTGSGATATASLGVTAASFTITPSTTTYSAAPTVTITGLAGGTGATATANLSGTGEVVGITITNAGTGFTVAPTIAFSGGTVLVTGTAASGVGNASNFTVGGISMTNPGSGYTGTPTLTFDGSPATATPTLSSVTLASDSSIGGTGDTTIHAVISESGGARALTKVGAGTLTLTGANTRTGLTTVSGGTLALVGGSLASSVTVDSGASLGFTVGSPASASGSVNFASGSTVKVTGTPSATTLMTASSFTGVVPALSPAIAGWEVQVSGTQLNLVAVASGYSGWASTNAGGQTANLDFDNDGTSNGIEYFMNAAAGFTANPGLVSNTVTWTNGGNIPFGDYGTQFVVQTSSDLSTWTNILAGNPSLNNVAGSVSYTVPTGAGKVFVRLKVTPN